MDIVNALIATYMSADKVCGLVGFNCVMNTMKGWTYQYTRYVQLYNM